MFYQPQSEKVPTDDLGLRIVKALPILILMIGWGERGVTYQQLIGDIKQKWKNIVSLARVYLTVCQS